MSYYYTFATFLFQELLVLRKEMNINFLHNTGISKNTKNELNPKTVVFVGHKSDINEWIRIPLKQRLILCTKVFTYSKKRKLWYYDKTIILTTKFPITTVVRKNGTQTPDATHIQSHIDSIHSPHNTRNTIMKLCMKSTKFQRGTSLSVNRS